MIIDFHIHIFPEKIASRAIASLEQKAKMRAHVSGVEASLRASMDKSGVDLSIILPVVTNPHQFETVNRVAVETNEHTKETGLLSFGGIHPENDNYREIIQFLAGHGCKGIKIHPVYQGVAIDDIRFLRIIDCAEEYGLVTITHAGYDIGFPGEEQSLPAAHKGGRPSALQRHNDLRTSQHCVSHHSSYRHNIAHDTDHKRHRTGVHARIQASPQGQPQ